MPLSISSGAILLKESSFFLGDNSKSNRLAINTSIFTVSKKVQDMSRIDTTINAIDKRVKSHNKRFVGKTPLPWNRNRAHKLFNDLVNSQSLQFHMWGKLNAMS